jgi:hypothetical protein
MVDRNLKHIIFLTAVLISLAKTGKTQISDFRGGGSVNVGTVRFYNIYKNLDGIYGNFAATSMSDQDFLADFSAILRFHDASFGEYSMSVVRKSSFNSFGLMIAQFGSQDYFERKLQFSYARQMFSNAGLGLNMNLMNIQNAELGNTFRPTIDLSLYSEINKSISAGASLKNILHLNGDVIAYPAIVSLALFYHPSDIVSFGFEASKIADRSFDLKMILQYQPSKAISLNSGVDILNQNIGFGVTYALENYKIGAATGQSNRLPMSTGLSFSYIR